MKRLEDEKQFKLAKRLRPKSPLSLEKICINFLGKTWLKWVSACNYLDINLFNNICKYSIVALIKKQAMDLDLEGRKTYISIPHID